MTAQAVRMLVNDYQIAARQKASVGLGISILCAGFFAYCARNARQLRRQNRRVRDRLREIDALRGKAQ